MEYIGLNHPQQVYAQRNLLYAEMEVLQMVKRYQVYKKLRKEELALKNLLRKKIAEVKEQLQFLSHKLPPVNFERLGFEPRQKLSPEQLKKRNKLDDEIEDIKKRLLALQDH